MHLKSQCGQLAHARMVHIEEPLFCKLQLLFFHFAVCCELQNHLNKIAGTVTVKTGPPLCLFVEVERVICIIRTRVWVQGHWAVMRMLTHYVPLTVFDQCYLGLIPYNHRTALFGLSFYKFHRTLFCLTCSIHLLSFIWHLHVFHQLLN